MLYQLPKSMVSLDLAFQPPTKPTMTGFARLETSPISPQLDAGLSAPLADPLWLIGRQWQFNELRGEDAGTPIEVDLDAHALPIDRFALGPEAGLAEARELAADAPPLEAQVEAEAVLAVHPRLDAQAGLNLLRRLRALPLPGLPGLQASLRTAAFALDLDLPTDPLSDPAGTRWHLLLAQRSFSAMKLASALAPGCDADGRLQGLPAGLCPVAEAAQALPLLQAWLDWLDDLVVEGPAKPVAWREERQEYSFRAFAQDASGASADVALRADEYASGTLDWHSFVAESAGPARPAMDPPPPPAASLRKALPVPVRYPGMPADRYWEFEDARVNFGGVEASPSSLVRMVMTEFALAYGNDWFLLPLDLPVGALYQLRGMQVRDNFGIAASVAASDHGAAAGTAPWRMFELSTQGDTPVSLGDTLCLAESIEGALHGQPLEEVLLVRDEMANLAWGIERRVQGTSGEPIDRKLEADRLAFRQALPQAAGDPVLVYRLATHVPAHWIPLVPKGSGSAARFSVKLERAAMARFYSREPSMMADADYSAFLDLLQAQDGFIEQGAIENGVQTFVLHPRGRLLKSDPGAQGDALALDRLALAEEEVPRAGALVTRRFQYARRSDGRSFLWIGRSKTTGTGEASSGLGFDVLRKRSAIH
jgi:hypothetical protein